MLAVSAAASLPLLPHRCSPPSSALRAHRPKLGSISRIYPVSRGSGDLGAAVRSKVLRRLIMAAEESTMGTGSIDRDEEAMVAAGAVEPARLGSEGALVAGDCDCFADDGSSNATSGINHPIMSTIGRSTNIVWHECPVGKLERQKLLGQKGCVIWITGLSGSGKSTLACALSRELYCRGHLSYVLDGDNVRHGLNKDLSFKPEDRAENIRRIGEVAKLLADAGIICIASLISPYRRDRDACRAKLPENTFIEIS